MKVIKRSAQERRMAVNRGREGGEGRVGVEGNKRNSDISGSSPNRG